MSVDKVATTPPSILSSFTESVSYKSTVLVVQSFYTSHIATSGAIMSLFSIKKAADKELDDVFAKSASRHSP